jgi:hypothetical protein
MQRRKFSREFKLEAVKLVRSGVFQRHEERAISTFMRPCCAMGEGVFGRSGIRLSEAWRAVGERAVAWSRLRLASSRVNRDRRSSPCIS